MLKIKMGGVREYAEQDDVFLTWDRGAKRLCIMASNESGCNCTLVDIKDLVNWYQANMDTIHRASKGENQ